VSEYNPGDPDLLEALWNLPNDVPDMEECKECGAPRGHTARCSKYLGPMPEADNTDIFCIDGIVVSVTQDQLLKLLDIPHMLANADEGESTMRLYLNSLNLDHIRWLASVPGEELPRYWRER
jgi:hypothetical protein